MTSVARGREGKPWVSTDGQPLKWVGRRPWNAKPYEKAEDLASALLDKTNTALWQASNACLGMARERGIYDQMCAIADSYEDPWNQDVRDELKSLTVLAQNYGGGKRNSGRGKAFHRFSRLVDEGRELQFVPPGIDAALESYRQVMGGFEVVPGLNFIANDEVSAAGFADRIVADCDTGETHVMVIRTGVNDHRFAMATTTLAAIWAYGQFYDQESGQRTDVRASRTKGLLCHVPLVSKETECIIYPLDLEQGWRIAKTAAQTVQDRQMRVSRRGLIAAEG